MVMAIMKGIITDIDYSIIAYCIMDNHLHLLMKVDYDKLEILMKRLNIKFAMHYNKIKKRYGHVFLDRLISEAVEDDKYLLGALRYIHNNPVRARMVNNILAAFIIENELEGKSNLNLGEKKILAKKLSRTNAIFHREVIEFCDYPTIDLLKSKER